MEYKVIKVNYDTKITEDMIGESPVEFKFIGGKGDQVKDILDLELKLHQNNELYDAQHKLIDAGEKVDGPLVEAKKNFTIRLNLKELSFDARLEIIRSAIKNLDLIDSTLILNIFNLIKGFNTVDPSFFASPDIVVNSMLEFVDMKVKLKAELTELSKEITRYFYSILRTVGLTDFPANNLPEVIPFIYQRIFLVSDFISLSNIIRKFESIDNLVYVENAEYFLQSLSTRYMFATMLIQNAGLAK